MRRLARRGFPFVLLFLIVIGQSGCVPSRDKEKAAEGERGEFRIVLDPGHGGKDVGALSNEAPAEKEIALDIALQVERLLKPKRLAVVLTRRTDEYLSLSERARIANDNHAALFVSIHANSCADEKVSGFEIYYAANGSEKESLRAATLIQRSLKSAANVNDRGVRKRSFWVLYRANCPSVLVEAGYLSNKREASLLSKPSHRKKIAEGIANGISAYVKSRRLRTSASRTPDPA